MSAMSTGSAARPRRLSLFEEGGHFEFCPNLAELPDSSEITVALNLEKLWIVNNMDSTPEGKEGTEGAEGDVAKGAAVRKAASAAKNPIYCQVGWGAASMLVAVNPNDEKTGKGVYDASVAEAFRDLGRRGELSEALPLLGPHCFALAESAYQGLQDRQTPAQSLICMGESGSGKTWNSRQMRNYLLDMYCASKEDRSLTKNALDLLTHFGNASSMYNDHATRYAAYTRLYFDGSPLQVVGARIEHFMLESTRFPHLPDRERNFHAVHYIAAANPGTEFRYLEDAGDRTVNFGRFKTPPDILDKLTAQMQKFVFTKGETEAIIDLILGLMYLSNVQLESATVKKFESGGPEEVEGCVVAADSEEALLQASKRLGLGKEQLTQLLTRRPEKRGIEVNFVAMTVKQSRAWIDSYARELYSRLFDYIVGKVNETLAQGKRFDGKPHIGLLDLGGFADRRRNYFEQLLLNAANELLQQHFVKAVRGEVQLREEEGIDVTIGNPLEDNTLLVNLLADFTRKPGGIVKLYDVSPETLTPAEFVSGQICGSQAQEQWKAGGESAFFIQTLDHNEKDPLAKAKRAQLRKYQDGNEKFTTAMLSDVACFAVKHTLGDVLYMIRDFRESGPIATFSGPQAKILDVLKVAKNCVLQQIVAAYPKSDNKQRGQAMLGDWRGLIDNTLARSRCHYLRCLRPNTKGHRKYFDDDELLRQLPVCGIPSLMAVQQAFPDSLSFTSFVNEFWCLELGGNMPHAQDRGATTDPRKRCEDLLAMFAPGEPARYKVGKTQLFLQHGVLEQLRHLLAVFKFRFRFIIKRKYRAGMGVGYFMMVTGFVKEFDEIKTSLAEFQLEARPEVQAALAAAAEKFAEAQQPEDAWSKVAEAWAEFKGGHLPPEVEADLRLVGASQKADGFFDFVEELKSLCGRLRRHVEEGREADAKAIEAEVEKRKVRLAELSQHLVDVQNEMEGEELQAGKEILEGCEDCLAHLEMVRQALDKICADATSKTFRDIFDPTPLDSRQLWWTCPDEVAKMCEMAEENCEEDVFSKLEALKANMQGFREAMTSDPKVQELMRLTEEAWARLDLLQDPSAEEVRELRYTRVQKQGQPEAWEERVQWADIRSAINTALSSYDEVKAEFEHGLNAEKYRENMERFLREEQAVQEKVEELRETLLKQEREALEMHRSFFDGFDKQQELSELHRHFMKHLRDLSRFVEAHPVGPDSDVDKVSQDEFLTVLGKVKSNVEALNLEVLGDEDAGEGLTVAYAGPWSAERFRLLGPEIEVYDNFAPVLDRDKHDKLLTTVGALNAGEIEVPQGFCVAWSETWGQYYMLYTEAAAAHALAALEVTQGQIKLRKKERRLGALRQAIGMAAHEVETQRARERLENTQTILENRLRLEVNTELAEKYAVEAQAEIDAKAVIIAAEFREERLKKEAATEQVHREMEEQEREYNVVLDEIGRKLRRAQIRMGSEGAFPSLFAQLVEAWKELNKLSDLAQTLLDHSSAELDELWQASGLAQHLVDRLGSYDGLRDLVKVLSDCQERHAQTEALVLDFGTTLSFPAMREARVQLTEVARSIKNVCDGTVRKHQGLEEELSGVVASLAGLRRHFGVILELHTDWHVRFATARHFVEQAMEQVDIHLDAIEEVKEEGMPKRGTPQDPWAEAMRSFKASLGEDSGSLTAPGKRDAIDCMLRDIRGTPLSPRRGSPRRTVFQLSVGDRVVDLYTKQLYGTVEFIGETQFASGIWAGVRLDYPNGRNDGTVRGVCYFSCQPGHGLFIRPNMLDPVFEHAGHADCCKPSPMPYRLERDCFGALGPGGDCRRPGCSAHATPRDHTPRSPRRQRSPTSPRGGGAPGRRPVRDIFDLTKIAGVWPA